MNFTADRPRWRQIADILRDRITDGTYQPSKPVPSEAQLIGEFGIARGTARKAVAHLRNEGIVYTVPFMGTFVSADATSTATDTDKPVGQP